MDRAELVDRRLRALIAEHHGAITLSEAKLSMDYRYRVTLPIVLASGAYNVTDEQPDGVTIRLREDVAS